MKRLIRLALGIVIVGASTGARADGAGAPNTGAVTWTPTSASPTFSKDVNISTITPGTATVQASGTIYVSKLGDLTSKVTSIASQGNATGTIVAAASTSASPTERADLIAWVRGLDNINNENRNADATDVRASVHGDVLHSRPAVVNYNRNGDENDVFVFYGANDGMLHAIKGASETSGGGKEQWAFIPSEFFGKLTATETKAAEAHGNGAEAVAAVPRVLPPRAEGKGPAPGPKLVGPLIPV